jgi:hypothetical protein
MVEPITLNCAHGHQPDIARHDFFRIRFERHAPPINGQRRGQVVPQLTIATDDRLYAHERCCRPSTSINAGGLSADAGRKECCRRILDRDPPGRAAADQ